MSVRGETGGFVWAFDPRHYAPFATLHRKAEWAACLAEVRRGLRLGIRSFLVADLGVLATPGAFNTSIRVTDAVGNIFDRAITFTVSPLQILSQSRLPKATVNTPYALTMTPYGGSGTYTWSATNLPPGTTMSAAGVLSGTAS